MGLGWWTLRVDSLKLAKLRKYTRSESAHKILKKTFVFHMWLSYVQLLRDRQGRRGSSRAGTSSGIATRCLVKGLKAMETYKIQKNRYKLCLFLSIKTVCL